MSGSAVARGPGAVRGEAGAATLLLVGCGKMGRALLEGWIAAGSVARAVVVEPAGLDFADPRVTVCASPAEAPAGWRADALVLAVKPQVLDAVVPAYAAQAAAGALVLSIAAGKTLDGIGRALGVPAALVRAMPNTPAAIGRGITVCVANDRVDAAGRALADRLMAAVGEVAWIADEALMDAVTAVSGSGPAYVFHLVECLAAAGAAAGLPPPLAERLALVTVAGSGALALAAEESPDQLRRNVTSPGGTTAAALALLMDPETGLPALMRRAVAAAAARGRELAG